MAKNDATGSAAHVADFDTSPHLNLIPPESESVTQTVQVYHKKKWFRSGGWKEVDAVFAHNLNHNLITKSLVERVGSGESFERVNSPRCLELRRDAPIEPHGIIILDLIIQEGNNGSKKTYAEPFVVVDKLRADLMLGKDLCEQAEIGGELVLGTLILVKQTEKQRKAAEEAEKARKEKREKELANEDRHGRSRPKKKKRDHNKPQPGNLAKP